MLFAKFIKKINNTQKMFSALLFIALVIIVSIVSCVIRASNEARLATLHRQVAIFVDSNVKIKEILGLPVIKYSKPGEPENTFLQWRDDFSIRLKGPKGDAILTVVAIRVDGGWRVDSITLITENGQIYDLSDRDGH